MGGAAGAGTWGQMSIGTFRWVRAPRGLAGCRRPAASTCRSTSWCAISAVGLQAAELEQRLLERIDSMEDRLMQSLDGLEQLIRALSAGG